MQQEGTASDRKRFEQYSRLLAIPLAVLQGFSYLNILKAQGVLNYTPATLMLNLLVITVVSVFMMWLGENITSQKLGNGISILIFTGIVAEYPQEIALTIANYSANPSTALMLNIIITFLMAFLVILGVIYVTEAERKIPVSYAKKSEGDQGLWRRLYLFANESKPNWNDSYNLRQLHPDVSKLDWLASLNH